MKVAIVRGPSLNKFEMQYYEPLAQKHKLVCFTSQKPVYDITKINLPIIKLPCLGQVLERAPGATRALYWLFGDPQGLIGLQNRLKGFDIAHTAELFSYYTHQSLMAKKKGWVKKVVATVSENIPFNQEEYPRQKMLKEFAKRNLDHILAISEASKKALMIEGYPEEKITVVPHGLDLEKFKPGKKDLVVAKRLGLENGDFVILSVGRLVWEKGFSDLLLAAKNLTEDRQLKNRNLKFVVIGSGPQKEELIRLSKRLGLGKRVIFQESLPYDQMVKVYNLVDIFVLGSIPTPTWQEQFGMVLVEAMACGVPVISTNGGGIPFTVGEAGILVSPGNWFGLAETLKELILDERQRKTYSQKGRERVKKEFDRQVIAKKIEEIYRKVLEQDK